MSIRTKSKICPKLTENTTLIIYQLRGVVYNGIPHNSAAVEYRPTTNILIYSTLVMNSC